MINLSLINILLTSQDAPSTERKYVRRDNRDWWPRNHGRLNEDIEILERTARFHRREPNEKIRKYLKQIAEARNEKENIHMIELI